MGPVEIVIVGIVVGLLVVCARALTDIARSLDRIHRNLPSTYQLETRLEWIQKAIIRHR